MSEIQAREYPTSPRTAEDIMKTYKGISPDDKHRIVSALKARGAGGCPRCNDSKWIVSEYSRIEVQATTERNSAEGTTIPAVMIVCQHCGFIAQHALQPLGLWDHGIDRADMPTAPSMHA